MARRSNKVSDAPAPEVAEEQEALLKLLNEKIGSEGLPAFALSAPATLTADLGWNNYKKKTFRGDEEFFLKRARHGKRSEFILEFEPVDAADYKQMEIEDDKASRFFSNIDEILCGLIGAKGNTAWRSAKAAFRVDFKKNKARQAETIAEQRQLSVAEAHKDNPLFGMF